MRLALVLSSLSRTGAGVFEAERQLSKVIATQPGVDLQAFGPRDAQSDLDRAAWADVRTHALSVLGPHRFGLSPQLWGELSRMAPDVVTCGGLWLFPNAVSHYWSVVHGCPVVVAPHGMLDDWALRRSRSKKAIAGLLFQTQQLKTARCIRAISPQEVDCVRRLGLRVPVALIPHGIELPAEDADSSHRPPWPVEWGSHPEVILYLGRIHEKKNLANVLEGWSASAAMRRGWKLAIAGWGDTEYERRLKTFAEELKLSGSVSFLGPIFGDEKSAALRHAKAMVLASVSEGVPMAILEGWAHRIPSLLTEACNLPEGLEVGAAIRIGIDPPNIAQGFDALSGLRDEERRAMGDAGRRLVEQRFTWERAARDSLSMYRWLLGEAGPPSCIVETSFAHDSRGSRQAVWRT